MKTAKKASILVVVVLMALTTLGITMAKQPVTWENYAYGTIDTYTAAYSAEVVNGYWNLKITDDRIHFHYGWLELNLDEDYESSPVGSVDELTFTNVGTPMIFEYDDENNKLEMFLQIQVMKEWAMFDGWYSHKTWKTWQYVTIDFDAMTIHIDAYPPEGGEPDVDPNNPDTWDWDKEGTVIASDY